MTAPPPPRRSPARTAAVVLGLFAVGVVLLGLGLISAFPSVYCEESGCTGSNWGWLWALWSAPLIWIALSGAARALLASGTMPADQRARRGHAIGLVLTVYAGAVLALALAFAEHETIFGNTAWLAFWLGALAGWLLLAVGLARLAGGRGARAKSPAPGGRARRARRAGRAAQ